MNTPQSTIRCRCGHQVLGRELLRTAPFQHSNGRQVVYLKYRCRRCKKLGEAFIPRDQWNPNAFSAPKNEMGALERDRFLDEYAISSSDVIAWSRTLQKMGTLADLDRPPVRKEKRTRKSETKKAEPKSETEATDEKRK